MTTPTHNSVPFSSFNPLLTGIGRYLADGVKWGGALGTGVMLTFSFQTVHSYYLTHYSGYNEYDDPSSGFLSPGEKAAIIAVLATWGRYANLTFFEATDSQNEAGDIRFGYTTRNGGGEAAHAYLPGSNPSAGDVWLDWNHFNPKGLSAIALGSYDFHTILHEVGHALGLKHSFATPNAIPAAQDNYFYSVMSYTASPWSAHGDDFASFYPTTPMYYDLVAIEAMYGRIAFHTGNDTYLFYDGYKYWQAIQDTGGLDTIQYKGAENSLIDLNSGHFSSLSEAIEFHRPNGATVASRGTVTIGPGVLIENATGGNGHDTLVGNSAGNILVGGAGNDVMNGVAGSDRLFGGVGNDTLYGGANKDFFVSNTLPNSATNRDTIKDFSHVDDTIQLENAVFTKLGAGIHALNPAFFHLGAFAADSNDYIIYNRANGGLFYDPNGSASGGLIVFAILATRPVIAADDFTVI